MMPELEVLWDDFGTAEEDRAVALTNIRQAAKQFTKQQIDELNKKREEVRIHICEKQSEIKVIGQVRFLKFL